MLSESKKQYHFKWKPEAADKLRVLKADYLGGGLWSRDVSFRMIWEMDNHKCQQYRHDLPHLLECSVSGLGGDSIGCVLPRHYGLSLIPGSWEELIVAACNAHTAHIAGEAEPGGSLGPAGQSVSLACPFELQRQWEILSQKIRLTVMKEDSWYQPLVSTCMFTHVHIDGSLCMCTPSHLPTNTHPTLTTILSLVPRKQVILRTYGLNIFHSYSCKDPTVFYWRSWLYTMCEHTDVRTHWCSLG